MRWNLARVAPEAVRDPSWADRLEAVGRLLDQRGATVRDVAVVTSDEQTVVSALVLRHGTHHSGWVPVSFGVVDHAAVPIDSLLAEH